MATIRALLSLFIFSLILPLSNAQAAEPPLMTLNSPGDFKLGEYSVWYEDSSAVMTPAQALALSSEAWQQSTSEALNFGFTHSAYWLRLKVINDSVLNWSIWIRYSLLDYVDIYLCPAGETDITQCHQKHGGDEYPFAEGRDIEE